LARSAGTQFVCRPPALAVSTSARWVRKFAEMQAQVPAMRRLSTAMFLDPGLAPAAPGRLAPAAPPAPPGVLRSEQLAGCQEGITVDERVMQQLRGIFAAHDSDKDLMLSEAQLSDAVRALGFTPSTDLQARFMARRPQDMQGSGLIDLTTVRNPLCRTLLAAIPAQPSLTPPALSSPARAHSSSSSRPRSSSESAASAPMPSRCAPRPAAQLLPMTLAR
jgi:hypothetical protein